MTLVYAAMKDVDPIGLEHTTIGGKKAKEENDALNLNRSVGCFPFMVMISSWASRAVPSQLQDTAL